MITILLMAAFFAFEGLDQGWDKVIISSSSFPLQVSKEETISESHSIVSLIYFCNDNYSKVYNAWWSSS